MLWQIVLDSQMVEDLLRNGKLRDEFLNIEIFDTLT